MSAAGEMREQAAARIRAAPGKIRVGIGGWTFAPWRGEFYPKGLPQSQELAYASARLTAIEINGTFYRTQTPATFRKWAQAASPGCVFSLKGPRYVTHRRVLAEAGDSARRFLDSGIVELGDRLGPILWQLAPTKQFDEADLRAFLEQLPKVLAGRPLRHALEVRHRSFCTPSFIDLLREVEIPVVFAEHATYPAMADVSGDFIYARLQKGSDTVPTGYRPAALDEWARRAREWSEGGQPGDLPRVQAGRGARAPRDVFIYFIHEGKVRAPAAAMALIERLRS